MTAELALQVQELTAQVKELTAALHRSDSALEALTKKYDAAFDRIIKLEVGLAEKTAALTVGANNLETKFSERATKIETNFDQRAHKLENRWAIALGIAGFIVGGGTVVSKNLWDAESRAAESAATATKMLIEVDHRKVETQSTIEGQKSAAIDAIHHAAIDGLAVLESEVVNAATTNRQLREELGAERSQHRQVQKRAKERRTELEQQLAATQQQLGKSEVKLAATETKLATTQVELAEIKSERHSVMDEAKRVADLVLLGADALNAPGDWSEGYCIDAAHCGDMQQGH